LINPRGSSSNTIVVLGVRESNLYRLKGQPMQEMANNRVAKQGARVANNKEQVAPKVEQAQREVSLQVQVGRRSFQVCQEGSWYKMAMQDAQEQGDF
jgi:hypothetical protein